MNPENATPALRFKGFEGEWEEKKLGECFSERTENMPDGELLSVTINDGIKMFSELDRHDNSNEDKSKYKKVCIGDIAYNSMRMWQGASGYSPYKGIVSPAYTVLVPNEHIDSQCLAYCFKLPQMIHSFQLNSQGITSDTWNLKFPTLSEIRVLIARDLQEQKNIAAYFVAIDRLISLQQQKLNKLEVFKKAMLDKMFPQKGSMIPEIRFRGFEEEWMERNASDLAEYSKGYGYSKSNLSETGTPIILYGRLYTNYQFSIESVDTYAIAQPNSIFSQGNEVIVPASGETAEDIARASAVMKPGVILGGDLNIIRPVKSIAPAFLALSLSSGSSKQELARMAQGKSIVHIHNADIQKLSIAFPSYSEQGLIVEYFSHLDRLISLQKQKLTKLQGLKKALLERMFPPASSGASNMKP